MRYFASEGSRIRYLTPYLGLWKLPTKAWGKAMNDKTLRYMHKALKAVSVVMILKGAVGGSLATLALLGFSVPLLGIEPTTAQEGVVATAGAIIGVVVAFRS